MRRFFERAGIIGIAIAFPAALPFLAMYYAGVIAWRFYGELVPRGWRSVR